MGAAEKSTERQGAAQSEIDRIARAICREQCAFYGEHACYTLCDDQGKELPWPNPNCDEPGCHALAMAAHALTKGER
jgi:hypothetical protein